MGASLYVKLDVNYFDDDKIMTVTSEAELLYVRSLCFAKRMLSDGAITTEQLMRIASDIPTDPLDPHAFTSLAGELVTAGLWEPRTRGWKIAAWEKHNDLADDVEAKRSGGERGNHKRWHTGKKGNPSEACSLCQSEGLVACDSEDRSDPDIAVVSDSESTEVEAEAQTETDIPPVGDASASRNGHDRRPYTERCEDYLAAQGIKIPPAEQELDHRQTILSCMVDEAEDAHKARQASIAIVADYLQFLTGKKLRGEARDHVWSLVGEFGGAEVLRSAYEAVRNAAGLDPKYHGDPLAVTKYMSAVLHGHGSKEAS